MRILLSILLLPFAATAQGLDEVRFPDGRSCLIARPAGDRPAPLFLTGMSNGAIMAQTYAAMRPGRVAAVVSVAGTMDLSRVQVRGPVPLLHIHGTQDRHVPFAGGVGESGLTRTAFSGVEAVLAAFRAPFGPMTARVTAADPARGRVSLERTEWRQGGRARVVLLRILGGGHEWPGGRRSRIRDLDAGAEAIRFFRAQL